MSMTCVYVVKINGAKTHAVQKKTEPEIGHEKWLKMINSKLEDAHGMDLLVTETAELMTSTLSLTEVSRCLCDHVCITPLATRVSLLPAVRRDTQSTVVFLRQDINYRQFKRLRTMFRLGVD